MKTIEIAKEVRNKSLDLLKDAKGYVRKSLLIR